MAASSPSYAATAKNDERERLINLLNLYNYLNRDPVTLEASKLQTLLEKLGPGSPTRSLDAFISDPDAIRRNLATLERGISRLLDGVEVKPFDDLLFDPVIRYGDETTIEAAIERGTRLQGLFSNLAAGNQGRLIEKYVKIYLDSGRSTPTGIADMYRGIISGVITPSDGAGSSELVTKYFDRMLEAYANLDPEADNAQANYRDHLDQVISNFWSTAVRKNMSDVAEFIVNDPNLPRKITNSSWFRAAKSQR